MIVYKAYLCYNSFVSVDRWHLKAESPGGVQVEYLVCKDRGRRGSVQALGTLQGKGAGSGVEGSP